MSVLVQCADQSLNESAVPESLETPAAPPRELESLEARVEEVLDILFASILELQLSINDLKESLARIEVEVQQRESLLRRSLRREMRLRAELIGSCE
ncbi:MAG TPA: hypothetical protein VJ302_29475 [Blastocatellia bacterium]|nr:hypothetical protein [Blastocatellia bacterium]